MATELSTKSIVMTIQRGPDNRGSTVYIERLTTILCKTTVCYRPFTQQGVKEF